MAIEFNIDGTRKQAKDIFVGVGNDKRRVVKILTNVNGNIKTIYQYGEEQLLFTSFPINTTFRYYNGTSYHYNTYGLYELPFATKVKRIRVYGTIAAYSRVSYPSQTARIKTRLIADNGVDTPETVAVNIAEIHTPDESTSIYVTKTVDRTILITHSNGVSTISESANVGDDTGVGNESASSQMIDFPNYITNCQVDALTSTINGSVVQSNLTVEIGYLLE